MLQQATAASEVREEALRLLRAFAADPFWESDWAFNVTIFPRCVGPFDLLECLGVGGMSRVYRARRRGSLVEVALKVLHRCQGEGGELVDRFRWESEVLASLNHPAIVRFHEVGVDTRSGDLFLAMELVRGQQLLEYCNRRQAGLHDRLDLFLQICEATHHAHLRGFVHRDLKPDNVLVTQQGKAKILDFGIAQVLGHSDRSLDAPKTRWGMILGTQWYVSPEQVTFSHSVIDVRSDVHALGVLLFELLTGQHPFRVPSACWAQATRIIQEKVPIRLGAIRPQLRGDLELIVRKALEKAPARRYDSAEAFAQDVCAYLEQRPIRAQPVSVVNRMSRWMRRRSAMRMLPFRTRARNGTQGHADSAAQGRWDSTYAR
jgi:serine/threonine-protein kinase